MCREKTQKRLNGLFAVWDSDIIEANCLVGVDGKGFFLLCEPGNKAPCVYLILWTLNVNKGITCWGGSELCEFVDSDRHKPSICII